MKPLNGRELRRALAGLLGTLALACASPGRFIWVTEYKQPAARSAEEYVIKPGDLVDVRVFEQDRMSGRSRVRSDGRVTLPFLNDVAAAGFTPSALSQQLQTRLKQFINSPVVTVSVEEARPAPISVMGKVGRPGQYPYEPKAGVLQALALAGGPNDFAHRDRIFVLRKTPEPVRIRFTYDSLLRGEGPATAFVLQEGDVVVVE